MAIFQVLPIVYQSQDISFTTWVSLFTLGLAPLAAHIVVGVPQPSYLLNGRRPKWYKHICHYNPTSIIWRYAMITDRRIRAKAWDRADTAATNALFWTARGWDGSEAMVMESLPYCAHLPEHARATLLSREMIKAAIVLLQGAQALVMTLRGLGTTHASDSFVHWMAVDSIFYPLSIMGLLRLCCSFWLTDDFAYNTLPTPKAIHAFPHRWQDNVQGSRNSVDSLIEGSLQIDTANGGRFLPTIFWASRVFRVLYVLPILAMSVTTILYMGPWTKDLSNATSTSYTTTSFLFNLFYLYLTFTMAVICGCYLAVGHTSTVIPCISALWYKVHTILTFIFGVVLVVVSCIETRKTPCGKYTSGSGRLADMDACVDGHSSLIPLGPDFSNFGLASTQIGNENSSRTQGFWVYNFAGTCIGDLDNKSAVPVELGAGDV